MKDKFAELKEAHKNGAVIQYRNRLTSGWTNCPLSEPAWDSRNEYRIDPNCEYAKKREEKDQKLNLEVRSIESICIDPSLEKGYFFLNLCVRFIHSDGRPITKRNEIPASLFNEMINGGKINFIFPSEIKSLQKESKRKHLVKAIQEQKEKVFLLEKELEELRNG